MSPVVEMELQLKALRVPYEVEYRFHPRRKWRLDFAIPVNKIGVEVHGGIWIRGHHTRGKGFEDDREKMNEAVLLGWLVLEVTPRQIRNGQAFRWLERALGR